MVFSSVGDCVANDAIKCLETVFQADLLAFAISSAVIGDGNLVDPARPRRLTVRTGQLEPGHLGRDLGLEAEPVALQS